MLLGQVKWVEREQWGGEKGMTVSLDSLENQQHGLGAARNSDPGPNSNLPHQNLHCNQLPGQFLCALKFQKLLVVPSQSEPVLILSSALDLLIDETGLVA